MKLFDYQTKAAEEFIRRQGRMLLWADTGTGKTAIAIECAKRIGGKIVYFVPAILKRQIADEFKKFSSNLPVTIIEGSKTKRIEAWMSPAPSGRVFIANYELLLTDYEIIRRLEPNFLIADECQRLNSPTAKSVKRFRQINPEYRLAMSGTPAPNAIHELWNICDWVSPGLFHETWWQFRARECRIHPAFPKILGYYDKDKIMSGFMSVVHRIRREDVLDLPPLVEKRIECELLPEQRDAYEKLKRDLVIEIKMGERLTVPNLLALITRLRQMAGLPEILGIHIPSGKMKTLDELINSISSNKIIIFSELAMTAKWIAKKYDADCISGDVPEAVRQEMLVRFKTKPCRIIVMTQAGIYGLNCQEADTVIHVDLPWNAAREEQRIARSWRFGQERPVTSYRIIARDTVDEKMERLIEQKRKMAVDELMDFFK